MITVLFFKTEVKTFHKTKAMFVLSKLNQNTLRNL